MRASYVRWRLVAAAILAAVCTEHTPTSAAPPQASLKLLVPAYFYPAGEGLQTWHKLIAAGTKTPVVAIANPGSGPGTAIDPAYSTIIHEAQAAKVTVIGYVSTSYAKRSATEIKHDLDQWLKFYPTIQGFFFDEQASEAGRSDFYLDLTNYARKKIPEAFVVTNPGTTCAEEYFSKNVADTICVIENGAGLEKYAPPPWSKKYPAERFYGLAYHVQKADGMRTSLHAAAQKHLGYVYVTDDKLPNPWDTLPPYWQAEVQAVNAPQ